MASSITGAPPLHLFPVTLLLLLLAAGPRAAVAAPNTAALSVLCNGAVYGADAVRDAGHDFYDISPFPTAFAYGHAACRAALTAADCAACLASAASQMDATCGHSVGARAVLVDCSVRYEQYAFTD
ncbi:hypothetical protein EJB05_10800, partial [Eragrostis curvula]